MPTNPNSDQSASGNGTVTSDRPTRFIDVTYLGDGLLKIIGPNDEFRLVPPGYRRCSFGSAGTSFTVEAAGQWIANPVRW